MLTYMNRTRVNNLLLFLYVNMYVNLFIDREARPMSRSQVYSWCWSEISRLYEARVRCIVFARNFRLGRAFIFAFNLGPCGIAGFIGGKPRVSSLRPRDMFRMNIASFSDFYQHRSLAGPRFRIILLILRLCPWTLTLQSPNPHSYLTLYSVNYFYFIFQKKKCYIRAANFDASSMRVTKKNKKKFLFAWNNSRNTYVNLCRVDGTATGRVLSLRPSMMTRWRVSKMNIISRGLGSLDHSRSIFIVDWALSV